MRAHKLLLSIITLLLVHCVADFGRQHLELPTAPVGLEAVATSTTTVQLSWYDTSDIEQGYVVEYKTEIDALFSPLAVLDADVQSYEVDNLTSQTVFTFRVKAVGRAGDSDFSSDATALTQSELLPTTLRLDAGLETGTSTYEGKVFVPMESYSEEPLVDIFREGRDIAATLNDGLYQTELYRVGDMTFSFAVNNGDYTVHIHNSETSSIAEPGFRLFDIEINGLTRLSDWNILDDVGVDTATVKSFPVTVTDGLLVVSFLEVPSFNYPKVCGVEILPQGETSLAVTP